MTMESRGKVKEICFKMRNYSFDYTMYFTQVTIAYRSSDSQWNSRVFLCAASFQSAEELFTKMLNFLQVRIKELNVGRGL